jgi:integrase
MRDLAATLAGAAANLAGGGLDAVAGSLGHVDPRTTEHAYTDRQEIERARRRRAPTVLDGGR